MNKYEFKATNLIAEAFEERDVKFRVGRCGGAEGISTDEESDGLDG